MHGDDLRRFRQAGGRLKLTLSVNDFGPPLPLGARLTATLTELILTDSDDLFNLGTDVIHPPHLVSRQGQAIGRIVLGAVSDDQDLQATAQPSRLRLIGVAPMGAEWMIVEPTIFLEATDEMPPLAPNALQQNLRQIPRVKNHVFRATAQTVTSITQ
jgi:hypothetical protein